LEFNAPSCDECHNEGAHGRGPIGDVALDHQDVGVLGRSDRARGGNGGIAELAVGGDETGSDALEAALARNVFGGRGGAVAALAAYVRRAAGELDAAEGGQILTGRLAFPAPRAILAELALKRSAESPPDETT